MKATSGFFSAHCLNYDSVCVRKPQHGALWQNPPLCRFFEWVLYVTNSICFRVKQVTIINYHQQNGHELRNCRMWQRCPDWPNSPYLPVAGQLGSLLMVKVE